MTDNLNGRVAASPEEIAHVDRLMSNLFGGLVKVHLTSGSNIVGLVSILDRAKVGYGILATVTLTTIEHDAVILNLLAIESVESAFVEYRSAFAAAGLLDLGGSNTAH
ncbi:hypothetical protein [Burkholderia lata]|uniref:Uncharacterized protein n=1 Tax=Burkholderia lata (strain ATCC 17760 / DSM 23089 / LMG 22485 / NCIMB 9086 / R18194 / 383) TaxID=482957 RepID=A0A6P2H0D7_BURL3|nr:hypothetical protein [Burkholderia lata]VWB09623.1 hypothetical protein BLA15945_00273 [Burkholderia lata]